MRCASSKKRTSHRPVAQASRRAQRVEHELREVRGEVAHAGRGEAEAARGSRDRERVVDEARGLQRVEGGAARDRGDDRADGEVEQGRGRARELVVRLVRQRLRRARRERVRPGRGDARASRRGGGVRERAGGTEPTGRVPRPAGRARARVTLRGRAGWTGEARGVGGGTGGRDGSGFTRAAAQKSNNRERKEEMGPGGGGSRRARGGRGARRERRAREGAGARGPRGTHHLRARRGRSRPSRARGRVAVEGGGPGERSFVLRGQPGRIFFFARSDFVARESGRDAEIRAERVFAGFRHMRVC